MLLFLDGIVLAVCCVDCHESIGKSQAITSNDLFNIFNKKYGLLMNLFIIFLHGSSGVKYEKFKITCVNIPIVWRVISTPFLS